MEESKKENVKLISERRHILLLIFERGCETELLKFPPPLGYVVVFQLIRTCSVNVVHCVLIFLDLNGFNLLPAFHLICEGKSEVKNILNER